MDTLVPNNPYVGPRSIKSGEAFWGRDRETRSLSALLIAERIVLLHSPSGAGKSSLIQAGLVPHMAERFSVFPLVRVNLEVPEEVRGVAGLNRYVLSTLLSLEEGLASEKRLPLAELATLTLNSYLERRALPHDAIENCLLLFDQFEEVLTTSPSDGPAKQQFFEQLGEALQNRRRWALFAIREDYMGGLAPYIRAIPNRLNVTFRLGLLGPQAAKLAIQQPARDKSVDFTDDAAGKLVDDLCRIQVQQPDGSFISEAGPDVEPVQLQVVCFNLWQSHAADDKIIDESDLQRVGSVDQALASYYANAMRSVAESARVDERLLRQWFDEHLITPDGIRSQVLKGAETTAGLPNIVLHLLENTHLIRGETRAGKTWYELSHDRLVRPVRQDNTAWFEHNLSLLQRQAVLWDQQGRSEGLLLRGKEFQQANKEAKALKLTTDEAAFMDACRKLLNREQRERRRNTLITILAIGATIAMVVAWVLWISAQQSATKALNAQATAQASALQSMVEQFKAVALGNDAMEAKTRADQLAAESAKEARISRARELATLSTGQGDSWPQRRLLLALAAQQLALLPDDPPVPEVDSAIREAVTRITPHVALYPETGPIDIVAFRGSQYFASSGRDGVVYFWNMENLDQPLVKLTGPNARIRAMVFSENGSWLAAGGNDGKVYLWEIAKLGEPAKVGLGHKAAVLALAFSKDGKTLVSGGEDRDLYIWSTENLSASPLIFQGVPDDPNATPGPTPTPDPYINPKPPTRHHSSIIQIIFESNTEFRSISEDNLALTWDITASLFHQTFGGSKGEYLTDQTSDLRVGGNFQGMSITALATFQGNSYYPVKVIGTSEGQVFIVQSKWDADLKTVLVGHERAINSIAVSADGKRIVTAGEEGVIRVWDLDIIRDANGSSLNQNFKTEGSRLLASNIDQIFSLSFDKIGKLLAVSGRNGQTEVWSWDNLGVLPKKIETKGPSYSKISPDGKWLAQVTDNGYLNEDALFNANSGKSLSLIDLEQQPKDPAILSQNTSIALAFSPDNHWLAYQDATDVILYDLQAGKGSLKLSAHKAQLISLAFSPDSRWLVSADMNSQAFLWDLSLPTPTPQKMGASAYPFYSLTFSPSGKYLGAGDTWGSLLIWNFASLLEGQLEPLRLFEQGCEGSSSSVDFNADESLLAQSCKQKVFFRNARKAYAIDSTFVFPFDRLVYQVKFSPDGNYLAVAGQGSTVYLYQVGRSLLENSICILARRNLTNQEWLEFFPNETYQAICPQWPSAK